MIVINGTNNTEQDLQDKILRAPLSLTCGMDNLRLRCAYARYTYAVNGNIGSTAMSESSAIIKKRLKSAPESFQTKNKPTYRILNDESKTKE